MTPAASAPGSRAGSATRATSAGPPIIARFRSRGVAIRILIFTLVSAGGAAYLALRERDWAQAILHDIGRLRPGSILLAAAAVAVQIACAGSRFWTMLPHERGSWLTVLRAFTLGEIVNQVGPPRAGEAVKVVTLSRAARKAPLTMPQVTGAIIAERLVDATLLVVLAVTAAVMLGLGAHTASVGSSLRRGWPTGALIAVLLGVFVVVAWKLRARLVRTRAFVREALAGLAILRKPARVLAGAACSLGAWAAEVVAIRILCTALGFPIPFVSAFVAVLLLNLGIAVPISVANLGTYEAALAFGLGQAAVPIASAVAIAGVHHALQIGMMALSAGATSLAHRWPRGSRPARSVAVAPADTPAALLPVNKPRSQP
jgi:uncharacterized membrane protein YbhN (UPF0104 family)